MAVLSISDKYKIRCKLGDLGLENVDISNELGIVTITYDRGVRSTHHHYKVEEPPSFTLEKILLDADLW